MGKINVGFPGSYKRTDWVLSFDDKGWSTCDKNSHGNYLYMHGLERNEGSGGIHLLEFVDCREDAVGSTDSQECYNANWWSMYT